MTVFDAYAIIAYFRVEASADEVAALLRGPSTIATLNAAEVVDQLVRVWGRDADDVEGDLAILAEAGLRLYPLDAELGLAAGRLRASAYQRSTCAVSMADCVGAVTALRLGEPLATSDPALAAMLRVAGGKIHGLLDSAGGRP